MLSFSQSISPEIITLAKLIDKALIKNNLMLTKHTFKVIKLHYSLAILLIEGVYVSLNTFIKTKKRTLRQFSFFTKDNLFTSSDNLKNDIGHCM